MDGAESSAPVTPLGLNAPEIIERHQCNIHSAAALCHTSSCRAYLQFTRKKFDTWGPGHGGNSEICPKKLEIPDQIQKVQLPQD